MNEDSKNLKKIANRIVAIGILLTLINSINLAILCYKTKNVRLLVYIILYSIIASVIFGTIAWIVDKISNLYDKNVMIEKRIDNIIKRNELQNEKVDTSNMSLEEAKKLHWSGVLSTEEYLELLEKEKKSDIF